MAEKPWPPPEHFADRLARLRRHKGVDNGAIAGAAGVSVKTVSHWIGGQTPDTGALLRLARYFGVSPEWLLNGDEPVAPQSVEDGRGTSGLPIARDLPVDFGKGGKKGKRAS